MMVDQLVLQQTPLTAWHKSHGAKLVEFGGWEMPLQFTKVLEEHHAVRKAAGLFDICHMGLLSIHSGDAQATQAALDKLVPQDLSKLYAGKAVYTQLLNDHGGIIDDIIVYCMPETPFGDLKEWMIICNAANANKVQAWLRQHLPSQVQLDYKNAAYSLVALQGPQFETVLKAAGLTPNTLPKRFHIGSYTLLGSPVLLSRTGYTGEDGVEILAPASVVVSLWEGLLQAGENVGLKPIGLAARDTLRLEAAYPLHGAELTEAITPLEAGLGWSVKADKPTDFMGKASLQNQLQNGLTRHFVCLEVLTKTIPRHHDLLQDTLGNTIGEVTSGSISPTLDKPIAVGYVHSMAPLSPGTRIQVIIRGKAVEAVIVKRPFYPQ